MFVFPGGEAVRGESDSQNSHVPASVRALINWIICCWHVGNWFFRFNHQSFFVAQTAHQLMLTKCKPSVYSSFVTLVRIFWLISAYNHLFHLADSQEPERYNMSYLVHGNNGTFVSRSHHWLSKYEWDSSQREYCWISFISKTWPHGISVGEKLHTYFMICIHIYVECLLDLRTITSTSCQLCRGST